MDIRADRLSRAVREHQLVIEARVDHRCEGGAHSYLADSRVVCWVVPPGCRPVAAEDVCVDDAPAGHAIDAEQGRQPVPAWVASRWQAHGAMDPQRFWDLWCATEVLAKLADVPMVVLVAEAPVTSSPVRRDGLEVHWLVRRVADVVVAQGFAWASTAQVT